MNLDRVYVCDIETNDLLANMLDYTSFPYKLKKDAKLWCVVIRNVGTGEIREAVKEDITFEWMRDSLKDCDMLIAHNGFKFDFITLKLFGVFDYHVGYLGEKSKLFGQDCILLDSLIISRITNPDRYKGHSLSSWGEKLGELKDNFREQCIEEGLIDKKSERGAEFRQWTPTMLEYCRQDTKVNAEVFHRLIEEIGDHNWGESIRMENKLADLAIRRETLGFYFDKDLAIKCVEDLTQKMQELADKVNPLLPPRPLNKTEASYYTPPKNQIKKDGKLSSAMMNFINRLDLQFFYQGEDVYIEFEGRDIKLPYYEPLKTSLPGTIDDMDHVKMYLIHLGWVPSEWRERDLTKDSKKQNIPFEKRLKALERWYVETMEGKYTKPRLEEVGLQPENVFQSLAERLGGDYPVRVPTSPPIRVGVQKELCPNLISLGEKVAFAKDFALYLTYKHRKSSIAGGDIEDIDLDTEYPNTGFLSMYREEDSRIPTPSIEIGASTNRYRHIGVANIARPSSIYGKEMRSLFGCGEGNVFFGFDYSSLENRIMGHYVIPYKYGEELAEAMVAEKPNDLHSINARKLGIDRSEAKSLTYALLYGAQIPKIMKMLSLSKEKATRLYEDYWNSVPALKALKEDMTKLWESTGKKYIIGIDGRKINIRSQHSILNALFQSAGVIFAKYVTVVFAHKIEQQGLCIDPFIGDPDLCSMIEYHDEQDMYLKPKHLSFKTFKTEEEAKDFVKNWTGSQLSAISKGIDCYYVALPSVISVALEESVEEVSNFLNIRVPMGFEYMVGRTWYECH